MNSFSSIKELLATLKREHVILEDMFEKRKSLYRYEVGLALVDEDEERLMALDDKGVLHKNGQYLELGEDFLHFFEQVLEVNEEINTSYVHENIQQVKEYISYFLEENNESRKLGYLKRIKTSLRKIGRTTLRNVIDLKRNIEDTFQTEPNYKIKLSKLENLDQKRIAITSLISQTQRLLTEQELGFFRSSTDVELDQIKVEIRLQLKSADNNLIEIQKQIIEYIHQIRHHNRVIEKTRKVKYLKDQFELRSKSNITSILKKNKDLFYEHKSNYSCKLSLEKLETDSGFERILHVLKRVQTRELNKAPSAGAISLSCLETETEEEVFINLEEVRNSFLASGDNLFDFIQKYQFSRECAFSERVTLFCQILSNYTTDFVITDQYNESQGIVYVLVYPKNSNS